MKNFDKKKKFFRLVILPLFVLLLAAVPGKKASAAEEYSSLIWNNNFSPDYMAVGKNGKQADDPFAGKLEDGGALWIGIRNQTLSTVFNKAAYVSTFENRDSQDKAEADTVKPMIVKNPESFRLTVKRPHIFMDDQELRYYLVSNFNYPGFWVIDDYRREDKNDYYLNGVIFDLYTYEGEKIGCSQTAKTFEEIGETDFCPSSMTSTDRTFVRENMQKNQWGDFQEVYRYFQVGRGLTMPKDYSFALVDCNAYDKEEYCVLPVIGKVTRDEAGAITDFEIVAQFSVIENGKSGATPYACWPERASLFKYAKFVYETTVQMKGTERGPKFVDLIHTGSDFVRGYADKIVLKTSQKIEHVTEYDDGQTVEITGDMELKNTLYVKPGGKLIVKSGATLTVSGTIVNQNLITVEKGGLLVVGPTGGITSINPYLPEKERIRDQSGRIYVYGDLVVLHGGYINLPTPLNGKDSSGIMVSGGTFVADGYVSLGSYCQVKENGHLQIEKEATFLVGVHMEREYRKGDAETFEKMFSANALRLVNDSKTIFRNLLSYLANVQNYEQESTKRESFNKAASDYRIDYDSFMSLLNQFSQKGWGFNLRGELTNNSGEVEIKGYNMFVKIDQRTTGWNFKTVGLVDY